MVKTAVSDIIKVLLGVFCVAFFLYGCSERGGGADGVKAREESQAPAVRVKRLNMDMTEQQRLQDAADNGGQVWRKEAADVAHAALIAESVNVRLTDCKVVEETPSECTVKAKVKENDFTIKLKRLVRPGGIWTATEISVDGPELTVGGGESVHVHGGAVHEGHGHEGAEGGAAHDHGHN